MKRKFLTYEGIEKRKSREEERDSREEERDSREEERDSRAAKVGFI